MDAEKYNASMVCKICMGFFLFLYVKQEQSHQSKSKLHQLGQILIWIKEKKLTEIIWGPSSSDVEEGGYYNHKVASRYVAAVTGIWDRGGNGW